VEFILNVVEGPETAGLQSPGWQLLSAIALSSDSISKGDGWKEGL